jgi:gliding motility-associated-like protein
VDKVGERDYVRCFLCILLACSVNNAIAQYETANWIFSEYTLNFVSEQPTQTRTIFANEEGEFASFSSDEGELLLATDGSNVWNGKGNIMKNGKNVTPYRTKSMIIPKPASDHQFYIFSYNAFNVPGNTNNMLSVIVYSIVDLKANDNQGEVLEKNKVLYNNMHGTFTISGNCDRSVFWLIGDVDSNLQEGTDKILTYQIDKNGISGPFTSKPLSIGSGSNFKLSPDAKKFVFTATDMSGSGTLISDFQPENFPGDPLVNVKWLPATGSSEFSSNGRYVYIVGSNHITQYDIQTEGSVQIFSSNDFLGIPQMAANGKIYIPVGDLKKFMVINKPDQPGFLCDFNEAGITIPMETFVLPVFASNLFYYRGSAANAGGDKEICDGESVMIGSGVNNATTFSWSPVNYLDDPTKLQPTFQYTGTDIGIESFTYKLTTVTDGCTHHDLVVIRINSKPAEPVIYGSKSVCPLVEGVQYWTDKKETATYSWAVSGGTIVGDYNSDSLVVNWGPASSDAQVELKVTDDLSCSSDVTTFAVMINSELQTETPVGLDSVCVNLRNQRQYQITKTTGSTYTWGVSGGKISSVPGLNKVSVDWDGLGLGKIWVTEKSVTSAGVCVGNSDTLNITVFKDPATINLDYISIDERNEQRINLSASTNYSNRIKELRIASKREDSGTWQEIGIAAAAPRVDFSQDGFETDTYSYQFRVDMLNKCNEQFSSTIHNSILLTAAEDEVANTIDLQWRPYNFGTTGDVTYEILTSFTEPTEFSAATTLLNDTSASIAAEESLFYMLRVKAVRSDGFYTSLSNVVKLEFNRELVIPNVITPNEDGFNDSFEIKNIKLFPQNRLIIINRYGKTLIDESGYKGGWNGDDVASGIYYFNLLVPEKQQEYKGWLQVIR